MSAVDGHEPSSPQSLPVRLAGPLAPWGDADAGTCVDGVCALPEADAGTPTA